MSDWQFTGAQLHKVYGVDPTLALATFVDSHASANTKGAWTALGTTVYPAQEVQVSFVANATALKDHLVDIGIGAGGSEVVLFSNLAFSAGSDNQLAFRYRLPADLPAGTALSARTQCSTGAEDLRVQVHTIHKGFFPSRMGGIVTPYGANTATSGGLDIPDADNSANTKGAWTAIAASLTYPARYLYIAQTNLKSAAVADVFRAVDIGVGAAASEVVIHADIRTRSVDGPDHHLPSVIGPIPVSLPAGTRVSLRSAISSAIVGAKWNAILYAIS